MSRASFSFTGALSSSPVMAPNFGSVRPHSSSFSEGDAKKEHPRAMSVKASASAGAFPSSAPVVIPNATATAASSATSAGAAGASMRRLSTSRGSLTPKDVIHHGFEDRAVLTKLVAPVRPSPSPKTVGFAAPSNSLTRPLMNTTISEPFKFMGEDDFAPPTNKTTTAAVAPAASLSGPSSPSPDSKPSLLTKALSSEPSSVSSQEDRPDSGLPGSIAGKDNGFTFFDEEKSLRQEKVVADGLVARHEIFGAPLVKLAFEIARCAHSGQLRRNGETYLAHLVETSDILARLGLDEQTVAAGLLHDVLDDTMMTEGQLEEYIPKEVVQMVVGVSRMSQVSQLNRDHSAPHEQDGKGIHDKSAASLSDDKSDRFRNMLLSMADVRVVLIKLADRLHNMRTLNALTPEKQRTIAEETLHVFVPLANRLGVWSIKAELEDLCFRYLHRRESINLQNLMNDDFMKKSRDKLQTNLDRLQDALDARDDLRVKDLHGRPKNIYGIYKKMQKKGIRFEDVYDLCACRVIVKSKEECYRILDLVHAMWQPMEGKLKDYISEPKANGYESLHTVVVDEDGMPFEIQIRTAEMHFIAEYGVAAHWQYKESSGSASATKKNKKVEQQIAWSRWLLTWQMELQDRKFRPSGSPGAGGEEGKGGSPERSMLSFPDDEPSSLKRPQPPSETEYDPVYAIVQFPDRVAVREVAANTTLEELAKELAVAPGTQFLVNSAFAHPDTRLRMGDFLEVLEDSSKLEMGMAGRSEEFFDMEGLGLVSDDEDEWADPLGFERERLGRQQELYYPSRSASQSIVH